MRVIGRALFLALMALFTVGVGVWGTLLLWYATPAGPGWRLAAAATFAVVTLAAAVALASSRWRRRALALFALACLAPAVVWTSLKPSNDRDWQAEVAVLPFATIDGDRVTVHNVRNFDYRTETDVTPAYEDRQVDLRDLEFVDVVTSYWMGPAIAHVFLSFGFKDQPPIAISIEARKSKDEGYSTLMGFFRQYELVYVVADERDVIRVRTNYRRDPPEDVYVYRATGTPEMGRRLFLQYLREINSLHERPRFYNALTTNCTTAIWTNTHVNEQPVPLDWRVLASGYLPDYLYEQGRLQTHGLSFDELHRRAHVNARARLADRDPDFWRRIREPDPGSARVSSRDDTARSAR